MEKITINGQEYVKANSVSEKDGMKLVMVRTNGAGVHMGYLRKLEGQYCELVNSRRMWYWEGACSLSQLAMEGTKKPNDCKFPCVVGELILTTVVEVITVTDEAKKSIDLVPVWEIK